MTKTDEDYDPLAGNFHLTPEYKKLYDTKFDQADRQSEEKMRSVLRRLELPDSTLDKIWELSDQDKDGFLDRYELTVAAHLTVRAATYGDYIPDQVVIFPLSLHLIMILYIAASP